MSSSKVLFYICLSFVGGIFLSSFFKFSCAAIRCFLALVSLLFFISIKHRRISPFCLLTLFLFLGILRYQWAEVKVLESPLHTYNSQKKSVSLIGVVIDEPDIKENSLRLKLGKLRLWTGNKWEAISGKILVTTPSYFNYQYGDKLIIKGKLRTPTVFNDFNYKDYLKKEGIYSVSYYPRIGLLERNKYYGLFEEIYSKILIVKRRLRKTISETLPPVQSSFLGAVVLGDKRKISGELKRKLNIVGLRHIVAVSGMHVAILTSILMSVLIGLGLWRQQAFYFVVILIPLFVVMTGLQPSAIRAAVMGGFFLFAQYLGRENDSSRSIVFAATLMLVYNPFLLKLDVGFQLSFLAMMGIIYLSPLLRSFFKMVPEAFQMRNVLSISFSAQVFTLPILIYNFGYISIVSPITNLLVVPLLYWVMLFGFIFVVFGLLNSVFAFALSLPVWLLLTYIIKIIEIFSKVAFASITLHLSWIYLFLFYLILGIVVWRLLEKRKFQFLG